MNKIIQGCGFLSYLLKETRIRNIILTFWTYYNNQYHSIRTTQLTKKLLPHHCHHRNWVMGKMCSSDDGKREKKEKKEKRQTFYFYFFSQNLFTKANKSKPLKARTQTNRKINSPITMKLLPASCFLASLASTALLATVGFSSTVRADEEGTQQMVKMCLFYGSPSGHARTDPIIDQQCASGHVHTVRSEKKRKRKIETKHVTCSFFTIL